MAVYEQINTDGDTGVVIRAVDLFCGAGGTSSGLVRACKALGVKLQLVAVNHNPIAIDTHTRNHKHAIHYCTGLDSLEPKTVRREAFQLVSDETALDILIASPECTHHSNARGGKPVNDQSRASGLHVARWIEIFRPWEVLLENVPEYRSWGPTKKMTKVIKGKKVRGEWPDPTRKGESYQALLAMIRSLVGGYEVEDKILVAADYGDPTTRKRLFVRATRAGKRPAWPAQSHTKVTPGQTTLFPGLQPWRSAKDHVIDWSIQGQSIFDRKKPLADSTMNRIVAGLKRFGGKQFVLPQRRFDQDAVRDIESPLHTITANGGRVTGLVEPVLMSMEHGGRELDPAQPMPTITSGDGFAVATAVIEACHGGGDDTRRAKSVDEPLGTVVGSNRFGIAEAFVMSAGGPEVGARPVSEPLNTVLTRDHMALVEPTLVTLRNNVAPRSTDQPVPTVSAGGTHIGLTDAVMVPFYGERAGQAPRTHSVDEPVPTIPATGGGKFALVQPFMVTAGGPEGQGRHPKSIDDPVPTILTENKLALIEVEGEPASFLLGQHGGATARPVTEPVPTIATGGAISKTDAFVIPLNHGGRDVRTHDVNEPMPTITTIDAWALIEPFIVQFYGSGSGKEPRSTAEPLPTVTSKDRFGLVRPVIEVDGQKFTLDIRFRMLTPKELARAMSFDEDYQFTGNREDQVKQIGNAVPCELAKALCMAALEGRVKKKAPRRKRQAWTSEKTA